MRKSCLLHSDHTGFDKHPLPSLQWSSGSCNSIACLNRDNLTPEASLLAPCLPSSALYKAGQMFSKGKSDQVTLFKLVKIHMAQKTSKFFLKQFEAWLSSCQASCDASCLLLMILHLPVTYLTHSVPSRSDFVLFLKQFQGLGHKLKNLLKWHPLSFYISSLKVLLIFKF